MIIRLLSLSKASHLKATFLLKFSLKIQIGDNLIKLITTFSSENIIRNLPLTDSTATVGPSMYIYTITYFSDRKESYLNVISLPIKIGTTFLYRQQIFAEMENQIAKFCFISFYSYVLANWGSFVPLISFLFQWIILGYWDPGRENRISY